MLCVFNFVKSAKISKIREKKNKRKLVHLRQTFPKSDSMTSSKIKNIISKTILAPWYSETVKIPKFFGDEGFCFLNRVFNFLTSWKRGKTWQNLKLREVWPWHSMLKNCKITEKTGFQFCKFTFLGVSDHAICKLA